MLWRLIAVVDLAAAAVSALLLFVLGLIAIRGAAAAIWQTAREMFAVRQDRWLAVLIIVALGWCTLRWKAAWRALDEFRD